MTDKIRVIVNERGYDEDYCVHNYSPDHDDVDDTVEVEKCMYDEWLKLTDRLEELEDYFSSFRSKNQKTQWEEHVDRIEKEKAHRAKMLDFVMKDPGYINAQERLNNAKF